MIGLLMLVGEVVRGAVVPAGSLDLKTASEPARVIRRVNGPPASGGTGGGSWSAAGAPAPASGEPR